MMDTSQRTSISTSVGKQSITPAESANEAFAAFGERLGKFAHKVDSGNTIFPVEAVFKDAASLVRDHPEKRQDVITAITKSLNMPASQVGPAIDDAIERFEYKETVGDLGLAPAVVADYEISDILPSTVASRINQECAQTGSRPLASALLLLTAMGALLGSRVQLRSGKKTRTPVPGNLNTVITGNSSADKSVTADPIVEQMKKLNEAEEVKLMQALAFISDSDDDATKQKAAKAKLYANRKEYYVHLSSFSPEAVTKHVTNQEPRAGFLLHRDEASGLFAYKRWIGGAQSSFGGGAGDSSTDEFSEMIMDGMSKALDFRSSRVSDDKERRARNQTLSISGCLQNKYLNGLFDFGIDQKGWTARWIFVRAVTAEGNRSSQRLSGVSPVGSFMEERLIPFVTSIRPTLKSGEASSIDLEFSQDDGAQDAYDEIWEDIRQQAEGLAEKGIEPAFVTYCRKGPVRVVKFALLIHILESLEGARSEFKQVPTEVVAPESQTLDQVRIGMCNTFKSAEKRVNLPVSHETLQKAIALEKMILKEHQEVSMDAHAAQFEIQKAVEQTEALGLLSTVLKAIQKEGCIVEADLKKKIRTSKLKSSEITKQIEELARRGCITRTPQPKPAKSYLLEYVKGLRS